MNPGALNLAVRQGDSYAMLLALSNPSPTDPTGRTPGTALDLTGCEAEMQIRDLFGAVQLYLSSSASTANGSGLTLGGAAGTVNIVLTPADSLALIEGHYDLRVKFPDGEIWTLVAGRVDVAKAVTVWQ